jgi:hypothetical protein
MLLGMDQQREQPGAPGRRGQPMETSHQHIMLPWRDAKCGGREFVKRQDD